MPNPVFAPAIKWHCVTLLCIMPTARQHSQYAVAAPIDMMTPSLALLHGMP
jgi:hypothetical protein